MTTFSSDELADVASQVLESIVFAFSEPLDTLPPYNAEKFLTGEVTYSGSHTGKLTIVAPASLCQDWADMMSSKHSPTIVFDTLAELTNIVAGHWVSRHFAKDDKVNLNPPTVCETVQSSWEALANDPSTVALCIDDRPLVVQVTIQE